MGTLKLGQLKLNVLSHYILIFLQTHHKQCPQHDDIPHVLFDYHQEVKSGSEKNLTKLKVKVQKYVEKFSFYTRKGGDVTRYLIFQINFTIDYHYFSFNTLSLEAVIYILIF